MEIIQTELKSQAPRALAFALPVVITRVVMQALWAQYPVERPSFARAVEMLVLKFSSSLPRRRAIASARPRSALPHRNTIAYSPYNHATKTHFSRHMQGLCRYLKTGMNFLDEIMSSKIMCEIAMPVTFKRACQSTHCGLASSIAGLGRSIVQSRVRDFGFKTIM